MKDPTINQALLTIITMGERPGTEIVAMGEWQRTRPLPFDGHPQRLRDIRRVEPPPGADPTWCYWEPGEWRYFDGDGTPLPDHAAWIAAIRRRGAP